jgi:hypothetical protein
VGTQERGHSIVPAWSCRLVQSRPIVPVWTCRLVQSLLVLWSWDRPLSYCVVRPPGPGIPIPDDDLDPRTRLIVANCM